MRNFNAIGVGFPLHVGVIETEGARTDNLLELKPHMPEFQLTRILQRKYIGVASCLRRMQQKSKPLVIREIRR
nr:hypothetical protein [Rhodoferax sp.]